MHDARNKTINNLDDSDNTNDGQTNITVNLNMRVNDIIKMFMIKQLKHDRKTQKDSRHRTTSLNIETFIGDKMLKADECN